jgi:ESCRT-I complex subunit TSG101
MHTLTGLSAQRHQQQHGRPNPDTEPPPLPPPPPGIKHDSHVYQSQRGADAMVPPPLPPKQIVAVGSLHQGHNRSASQGREEDVRTSILLPAVPSCSKFDGVQGIQPQPSSEKHHVSNLRYSTAPALPSLYGSPPSVPNQRPSQHTDSSEGGTVQISVSRSPNLHDGGVEGMKLNPADASRMSQEDTVIRPSWRSPLVPLHDVLRGQHHGKPDARSSSQLQSSSAPLMLPDLLDEPTPRASVSPMVPVAPPPVPLNPQKDALVRQLASTLFSMRQATRRQDELSLGGLAAQHAAIRTATAKLQTEFDMLSQLSSLLMSNTSILHDSLRKADIVIERSRSHPETEIDDLLVAPTVVGNQLYTLVAEERAIGDAIFAISRAMEKGRISAAVFTKCTRSLAREWYIKKALIREITLGMGLSPGH